MPKLHTIKVRDRIAEIDDPYFVQYAYGVDTIALDLDGEWDGLEVSLVLSKAGQDTLEVEWQGSPVPMPYELMKAPGRVHPIVVGRLKGQRDVTARCIRPMSVLRSGDTEGREPDPQPDDYTPRGKYTAGTGISIDDKNVISADIQAAYPIVAGQAAEGSALEVSVQSVTADEANGWFA